MELAEGSDCVLTVAVSDDASLVADGQLAATVRQGGMFTGVVWCAALCCVTLHVCYLHGRPR